MHSTATYQNPDLLTLSGFNWYYNLKNQIDTRFESTERFFTFTRNLKSKPTGESHKYEYLVEFFVNEITGPYDQDISFLLVGNKGRGKSLCALSMAFYTACELAERFGGKWTDYFDPDTNMAIILEDEANKVMAIQEKYQVKNYDDIGIGWGARDWQHKDNKDKNDVFQINRTDNTLQLFSVPNQFLLDKVPRSLVSHYGEMAQQFYAHGFTTVKIFEPETLFREGKIIQPYLNIDRTKYVLFRIPKPPDDLVDYYKKRRKINKSIATKKRLTDDYGDEQAPVMPVRKNPKTLEMEAEIMKYKDVLIPVIQSGGSRDEIANALIQAGVYKIKAKRWAGYGVIEKLFPRTS